MAWDEFDGGYFAVLTEPILDDATLSWPAMVLYAKITNLTRKTGFCYATNKKLIEIMTRVDPKTGEVNTISERTLQTWLSELKGRGHILVDTGPLPPDKNGVVRQGRRIFIGMKLALPETGEKNFTPAEFFTHGVQNSAPPIKGINNKNKKNAPIAPKEILEEVQAYCGSDCRLLEAFVAFLTMRAVNLKNPVDTPYKLHLISGKLDRESNGSNTVKVLMLDNATNGKWSKVWPLKAHEMPERTQPTQDDEEGIDGI